MEISPGNGVSKWCKEPEHERNKSLDLGVMAWIFVAPKLSGEHKNIRIQVAMRALSGAGLQYVGVCNCMRLCVCLNVSTVSSSHVGS